MKKILILNGHPDKESFCYALADQYKQGAEKSGAQCEVINLIDLDFHPVLKYGYRKRTELEPDLLNTWEKILEANHIVFVYPTWWGTQPALLSGFIERLFLPNFAFKYRENSIFWDKLLKGRSARIIVTMDTPKWYYWLMYKSPGHNTMKKVVLGYCGIAPTKITAFSPIKNSSESQRKKWLKKVYKIGQAQR